MTTIKFRRDYSANWTSINPIPAQGEPCYEIDTEKLKIGNGADHYTDLPYITDGGTATLPVASSTTLGGIKVGDNLSVTEDGILSTSSEAKTVVTPDGLVKLDNAGLHNADNSRAIISRDPNGLEVHVGNIYESTVIDGSLIRFNSLTITDRDGNTFLTGAPTNMVTTDTDQIISSSKTFTKSITSAGVHTSNDITFDDASTSRYINNVNSITGGYRSQEGCLKLQGDTTLTGDNKLILNGRNGGITLQADSGKLITTNNILLCSAGLYSDAMISTAGESIIAANTDKSVSVGQYQYDTILKNPVIAYTSTTNSSIYFSNFQGKKTEDCITYNNGAIEIYAASGTTGTTKGTSFRVTDLMKTDILAVDFNGNITGNGKTYINSENIDTTYMKWNTANKKLTVDTAAVAHLAMPSSKGVTLTLGASGTSYTAPADGYVSVSTTSSYTGWIKVDTRPGCYGYANGGQFCTNTPVIKNTSFKVWYSFSSGDVSVLQYAFYYCNGTTP